MASLLQQAQFQHQQGRLQEALSLYQQLLATDTLYRDIYHSQLGQPPVDKAAHHD